MINNFILESSLLMIVVAIAMYLIVLDQQRRTFRRRTTLQPLKWLLFSAVILLIIGAVPLGLEYANILWWHYYHPWTVNLAIFTNAIAKVVVGIMLYQIYKFRSNDDDLF